MNELVVKRKICLKGSNIFMVTFVVEDKKSSYGLSP